MEHSFKSPITQQRLREICWYDPVTGHLIWKESGRKRILGNSVGSLGNHGYLETSIHYKRYLLHRLVWLYHKGRFPADQIDHINHIRTDNRIENLREATNRENNFNQSKRDKPASSKWRGVSWSTRRQAWKAAIKVGPTTKHVGYFNCEGDAAMAWNAAAEKYYGVFANLNCAEQPDVY